MPLLLEAKANVEATDNVSAAAPRNAVVIAVAGEVVSSSSSSK